ncbi:hypothetical protein EDC40_104265 [Aminobacter aminovorans]|uniref:Uncharacterized protein n=1 Tax=Aminobacter aminovorans TaxID=83263 RepID=A0A380WIZ1_AMIAI|nr:hypothetical protein [Aminobacter aminovorans]TCS26797.1 hypothetical protein EDC40_104265 [Aminobacter aminovorans]SUU88144.1 Uncharacterised protein [Aminobacter aminovorans]
MITKRILPAILGLLVATTAAALAEGDRYRAFSATAESITGDISMDDFSITFANGQSLKFAALLGDHFVVDGERVNASLYSVEDPSDPELENGNRLCGAGDVTHLASWSGGEGLTVVAVFTGDEPPESSADLCASYTYQD